MISKLASVALGEVCDVIGGGTPSKDRPEFYGGDIPWATVRDMQSELLIDTEFKITPLAVESSSTNIIPKGNVVIATRVGLGRVCLLQQDTAINQDLRAIVPKNEEQLSVSFLFWWLKSVAHLIVAEGTGATVQGVKLPFIKSLAIPLPTLSEQRRIVAILDETFAGLATATANAETNLKNTRELFVAYLQSTFDARHDQVPLHALTTEITDGDHSPPPKAASGVPFITISNIVKETGEIDFDDTFFVPREYFENLKPNKKPKVGDILYTVTGATLGIPVLVKAQREFCFQRHIGLIRPKSDVDSSWLTYALGAPYVFAQATIGSTGAAQKTVSLKVLRNIEVPKASLFEQQMVARKLDDLVEQIRRLAAIYRQKLELLVTLREVILQKAFAGELTSPGSQAIKEAAE